jgi:ParB-like chromosome segregation protein Spo0J
MPDHPGSYSIDALLNSGIQPLDDLPDDELDALGKALGRGPLAVPVAVSADGILLDGHQRLKALRAVGRKRIDAGDVRVIEKATSENALEWAIQLNVARRHLTVPQKADLARKLQRERRWSQRKIARVFGVTQPAVAQWLAATTPGDGEPPAAYVTGLDGKSYPTPPRAERPPRHPWAPDGHAYKAVDKAVRALQGESVVAGLSLLERTNLERRISDLMAAAEDLQGRLAEPDQPPGQE